MLRFGKRCGMSEAVLGQAQLSLNLFELKPRFVRGLKRLEAHFIKELELGLKLYHKILGLSLSSITKYWA